MAFQEVLPPSPHPHPLSLEILVRTGEADWRLRIVYLDTLSDTSYRRPSRGLGYPARSRARLGEGVSGVRRAPRAGVPRAGALGSAGRQAADARSPQPMGGSVSPRVPGAAAAPALEAASSRSHNAQGGGGGSITGRRGGCSGDS